MVENELKTSINLSSEGSNKWLGRYAVSIAGHDSGRVYVIVGIAAFGAAGEPQAFYLADGRSRRAADPKLKKRRHIRLLGGCDAALAQKLAAGGTARDAELVRAVKNCRAQYALL